MSRAANAEWLRSRGIPCSDSRGTQALRESGVLAAAIAAVETLAGGGRCRLIDVLCGPAGRGNMACYRYLDRLHSGVVLLSPEVASHLEAGCLREPADALEAADLAAALQVLLHELLHSLVRSERRPQPRRRRRAVQALDEAIVERATVFYAPAFLAALAPLLRLGPWLLIAPAGPTPSRTTSGYVAHAAAAQELITGIAALAGCSEESVLAHAVGAGGPAETLQALTSLAAARHRRLSLMPRSRVRTVLATGLNRLAARNQRTLRAARWNIRLHRRQRASEQLQELHDQGRRAGGLMMLRLRRITGC